MLRVCSKVADKGYGATATPGIVAAAVATAIEAACPPGLSPREALRAGSAAYLAAMAVPGRTRLLLIEGPAALGIDEMRALDEAHAERSLREGLAAALGERAREDALSIDALTQRLSAAFDRAAIAID